MPASLTLAQLSALDGEDFVAAVGAVFEHSPWVMRRAWARRPVADREPPRPAQIDHGIPTAPDGKGPEIPPMAAAPALGHAMDALQAWQVAALY